RVVLDRALQLPEVAASERERVRVLGDRRLLGGVAHPLARELLQRLAEDREPRDRVRLQLGDLLPELLHARGVGKIVDHRLGPGGLSRLHGFNHLLLRLLPGLPRATTSPTPTDPPRTSSP